MLTKIVWYRIGIWVWFATMIISWRLVGTRTLATSMAWWRGPVDVLRIAAWCCDRGGGGGGGGGGGATMSSYQYQNWNYVHETLLTLSYFQNGIFDILYRFYSICMFKLPISGIPFEVITLSYDHFIFIPGDLYWLHVIFTSKHPHAIPSWKDTTLFVVP